MFETSKSKDTIYVIEYLKVPYICFAYKVVMSADTLLQSILHLNFYYYLAFTTI